MYLPISIDITDKKILMVGGGKVAVQKLKTLLKFTPLITVIAPDIDQEVKIQGIACVEREFQESDLDGIFLVYAATNNKKVNQLVCNSAKDKGILVNVADNPALSDFVSPAVGVHGKMTVAVGSNGESPGSSVMLRNTIMNFLEKEVKGNKIND